VVCADVSEIGKENAEGIARQFWDAQRDLVCDQVRAVMRTSKAPCVVTAGIGAPLFARELGGVSLRDELGTAADALPAFAVREVAERELPLLSGRGRRKR
jgi:uncharacterized hydantoinase/oxoprolinase family protein